MQKDCWYIWNSFPHFLGRTVSPAPHLFEWDFCVLIWPWDPENNKLQWKWTFKPARIFRGMCWKSWTRNREMHSHPMSSSGMAVLRQFSALASSKKTKRECVRLLGREGKESNGGERRKANSLAIWPLVLGVLETACL